MKTNRLFQSRFCRRSLVLFSVAAFLFVQAMMLHTHSTKHPHHHQGSDAVASGHFHHHSALHFITDNPDDDHHDFESKIDPPANSGSKNIKVTTTLFLALLGVLVLLCVPRSSGRGWQIVFTQPFSRRDLLIRPPLRAPPF